MNAVARATVARPNALVEGVPLSFRGGLPNEVAEMGHR